MGGHGTGFANSLLKLIFWGDAIANIADNAASSPLTAVYVGLHISDPTADGDQTDGECAYTSYARVAVSRDSSGWDITDNVITPVSDIVFPTCTGGSEVAKFWSIGTASSGAGSILYYGPLSPTISISNTVPPKIKAASSITEN